MEQHNNNKRTYSGNAFWNNPQPDSSPISQPTEKPPVDQQSQQFSPTEQPVADAPVTEFHPVITSEKTSNVSKKKGLIIGAIAAAVVIIAGAVVTVILATGSPKNVPMKKAAATQTVLSQIEDPDDTDAYAAKETEAADQTSIQESIAPTKGQEPIGAQVEYETRKVEVQNATYFKSASASSVLADQAGHNYKASNVLKNDGTCWCEDASDYGEGEWIKLELPAVQKVSGLRIVNGYAGTEKQYDDNSKISKMTIEFSDGRSTQVSLNVFDTSDRKSIQTIRFNSPVETEYVKLTIDSATKADCKDTCLTFVEPF